MASVANKSSEKRLRCYGHAKKRELRRHVVRRMTDEVTPDMRRGGRQETKWKDSNNRKCDRLKAEDVADRTNWTREIQNFSGDPR